MGYSTSIDWNLFPNGHFHARVSIWDDATRKAAQPDHVNDFYGPISIPQSNVTEWRRRIFNGVKQVQSDKGEWLDADVFKDQFLKEAITPAVDTYTPDEWTQRRVTEMIDAYVKRWRARGKPVGEDLNPAALNLADRKAQVPSSLSRITAVDE